MPRFPKRYVLFALLSVFALFLAACSEEVAQPRVPELTADIWNEFPGNTETECADGSDYRFFVRPGTVNKLVIDFQGGGACWDDGTCSLPIENPGAPGVYNSRVFGEPAEPVGIYNKANEANPIGDWYHAYIPYCTADIHLGNSTQTYTDPDGTPRTVQHKGQVNAQAVLDWVFAEFEAPETVFVTGCSAGAYGAIAYTPLVQERYPDADIYQMGDCGAGITPEVFFEGDDGISRWNTRGVLAELIPGLELGDTLSPAFVTDVYSSVGTQYPESVISQYNSAFDNIQILFYALQQGATLPLSQDALQQATQAWTAGLNASLAAIDSNADNFYSYTSLLDDDGVPENGTAHCIITRPEFYTYELDGVSFASWVDDLVNGRTDALGNVSPPAPEAALN